MQLNQLMQFNTIGATHIPCWSVSISPDVLLCSLCPWVDICGDRLNIKFSTSKKNESFCKTQDGKNMLMKSHKRSCLGLWQGINQRRAGRKTKLLKCVCSIHHQSLRFTFLNFLSSPTTKRYWVRIIFQKLCHICGIDQRPFQRN